MGESAKIKIIEEFVKKEMQGLCVSHDFFHIEKVVENARRIAEGEGVVDTFIIEMGALLHESLDAKFFQRKNINLRKETIQDFLLSLLISLEEVEEIIFIIENVGYGKSLDRTKDFIGTQNFQIVEDADRLEAIGAIAIARCFTYGGKKGRQIYNPDIKPTILKDEKSYHEKVLEETSFNHFFEKLLLLKDLMHTQTAKKIAEPRHQFMQLYVDTFLLEWNGEV